MPGLDYNILISGLATRSLAFLLQKTKCLFSNSYNIIILQKFRGILSQVPGIFNKLLF